MHVKIYTLTDPIDNQVKYVGRTHNELKIRLYGHLHPKIKYTNKAKWVYNLRKNNLRPIIDILEDFHMERNQENWEKAHIVEKYWIEQLQQWGFVLLNHNDKGSGSVGKCWHQSQFEKMNKPVFQYDLEGNLINKYPSIRIASIENKFNYKGIQECSKGGRPTANGYIWTLKEIKDFKKLVRKNAKTLYKYDLEGNLIKIYVGNEDLIKDGYRPHSAKDCASGGMKTYKNHVWSGKIIKKFKPPTRKDQIGKTIYQYSKDGKFIKTWRDTKTVANTLGIRDGGITQVALGVKKSFKGYVWSYKKY
jgi:hypothetical protein